MMEVLGPSRLAASARDDKTSFDENFPAAAADVSILRQINFWRRPRPDPGAHGCARRHRNQSRKRLVRATISRFGDAGVQPAKRAILRRRQIDVGICDIETIGYRSTFFLGDDGGGSPDILANVAAEGFFQIGNDAVANSGCAAGRDFCSTRLREISADACGRICRSHSRQTPSSGRTIVRSTSSMRRVETSRIAASPVLPAPRNKLIRNVSTRSSA